MTDHPSEWSISDKDKDEVVTAYRALKKDYDELVLTYKALRNVAGRLTNY